MLNNDPLLIIQEALYCGNYCDLTPAEKDYHTVMIEHPYPVKIIELLDYVYHPNQVDIWAIVQFDNGVVTGVKAQVSDATGTFWEPPDYTTNYDEVNINDLKHMLVDSNNDWETTNA